MNKSLYSLMVLAAAATVSSCGNKTVDEPEHFEGIYYEEGRSDRSYLEEVANNVLGHIKAADQRVALTALHAFTRYCEEYTFPDNFYDDKLARSSRALEESLEGDDYAGISRAMTTFVYNLARFKGLYQAQPDAGHWEKIENRESSSFRFWDGTVEYNINITGQGSAWSETVVDGDYGYTIEIPQTLDVLLYSGSDNTKTIISAKITSEGKNNDHLNVSANTRLGNIEVAQTIKATNSRVTDDVILYSHNTSTLYRTQLLSATVEVSGSNLCSISAWQKAADDEDATLRMMGTATATMMIYNSLQIKSNISNVSTFAKNVEQKWANSDYPDAKSRAENAARELGSVTSSELRYSSDSNKKVRGTTGWEAYMDDDNHDYASWGVRPTITLVADGATFDFESYFGGGRFLSTERNIKSLITSYQSYWK